MCGLCYFDKVNVSSKKYHKCNYNTFNHYYHPTPELCYARSPFDLIDSMRCCSDDIKSWMNDMYTWMYVKLLILCK